MNWQGSCAKGDGEGVDDAGVSGPEESIDDIVGGPLLEGTARGVV